jgi:hypothetical protein
MCRREEKNMISSLKATENSEDNKKIYEAVLGIRHIVQQEMKEKNISYDDILRIYKDYKNGQ